MPCAVAVVFALGAQKEAIEPAELAHRIETIAPPGKQFVDVALMTDVQNELVVRRVEDAVHRNGQFDDTEIRPQMAAGLRKDTDQFVPNFLRELGQSCSRSALISAGDRIPSSRRGGVAVASEVWADSEEFDFIICAFGFIVWFRPEQPAPAWARNP